LRDAGSGAASIGERANYRPQLDAEMFISKKLIFTFSLYDRPVTLANSDILEASSIVKL
jgi:hypothetical protein